MRKARRPSAPPGAPAGKKGARQPWCSPTEAAQQVAHGGPDRDRHVEEGEHATARLPGEEVADEREGDDAEARFADADDRAGEEQMVATTNIEPTRPSCVSRRAKSRWMRGPTAAIT
jgi:hypothetical protein